MKDNTLGRLGLGGGEADRARLEEELRLVSTMVDFVAGCLLLRL